MVYSTLGTLVVPASWWAKEAGPRHVPGGPSRPDGGHWAPRGWVVCLVTSKASFFLGQAEELLFKNG